MTGQALDNYTPDVSRMYQRLSANCHALTAARNSRRAAACPKDTPSTVPWVRCKNEAVNGPPNPVDRPRFDPADGVVDVTGLTKTFGTLKAVDDLTFSVTPGRVTGFLGPNGAGKTTTLRLLLGLQHLMPAPSR